MRLAEPAAMSFGGGRDVRAWTGRLKDDGSQNQVSVRRVERPTPSQPRPAPSRVTAILKLLITMMMTSTRTISIQRHCREVATLTTAGMSTQTL